MQQHRSNDLLELCLVFLSIGLFTIGGGYAMLPLIRQQVVQQRQWLSDDDFIDGLVVCQSCPGPLTVNVAVYAGMQVAGPWGALLAAISVCLPAFLIMLGLAHLIISYGHLNMLQAAFAGAKPAVAALVTFAAINLGRRILHDRRSLVTALVAAGILTVTNLHPLWIMLTVAGVDQLVRRRELRRMKSC